MSDLPRSAARHEVNVLVADRDLPNVMFKVRRLVGDSEGGAFARWLVRRELGQFLMVVNGLADATSNVEDEPALIRALALRLVEERKVAEEKGGADLDCHLCFATTPELGAKLEQLLQEIEDIQRAARA